MVSAKYNVFVDSTSSIQWTGCFCRLFQAFGQADLGHTGLVLGLSLFDMLITEQPRKMFLTSTCGQK